MRYMARIQVVKRMNECIPNLFTKDWLWAGSLSRAHWSFDDKVVFSWLVILIAPRSYSVRSINHR